MTELKPTTASQVLRRGLGFWLKAMRAPFFTGTIAPVLVGAAVAYWDFGELQWPLAVLSAVALISLHAGANLANDYYDHWSGNDAANVTRAYPFTGGSRFIQDGLAQPWEILAASLLSLGFGGAIGLYLVIVAGWPVLALGLFGSVTGFCYSAPPLKLGHRGVGEFIIMLDFGVLPVLGVYYLQAGAFSWPAFAASLPVGLLMTNVLWINQFQDMEADSSVGKRHWVARLGRRRSVLVHAALFLGAYGSLVGAVLAGVLPSWALLGLLGLPLAVKAAAVSIRRYDDLPHLTPANVGTIAAHFVTSVAFAVGLVLARLV